jgi:F5/8 type C domain-containing protein
MSDFAPHNMASNILPSPYIAHGSDSYSGGGLPNSAFDGNTGNPWIGETGGVGYLELDLGLGLTRFSPLNMSSNTAPSPYVASASSAYTSSDAFNAFNFSTSSSSAGLAFGHYWIGTGGGTDWLQIDLGSGTTKILGVYDIQVNVIPEPNRAPKNWTMQGSNNGTTWTTVDTRISETAWLSGQVRSYTCATQTTAYRYFRLNITANNGDATYTQVNSLYLYEAGTGPGVGSYSQKLGSYALKFSTNGAEPTNRGPKNWTVQGSNDGSAFTTVDTQTNQTAWTTGLLRTYTCGSPSGTAFRFWKIDITANNGDATYTSIGEMYLYTPTPGPGPGSFVQVCC